MRGVFWFRSDLRLRHNRGLASLAARVDDLVPVFVLDRRLLGAPRTGASRVRFLLECLARGTGRTHAQIEGLLAELCAHDGIAP